MRYAQLITMEVNKVRRFLADNPGHVAAGNALRELKRQAKAKKRLEWVGKGTAAVVDPGFYRNGPPRHGRCPTKRALR